MHAPRMIPLPNRSHFSNEEMITRAHAFYRQMDTRRTVRHFRNTPVRRSIIEDCIRTAGTAPSGAHLQPWHFVVVSDREIKHSIREAAEIEEREFYAHRAPREWLEALAPLGTDDQKPFLDIAPYLIAVFLKKHDVLPDGGIRKHYYAAESVGIATGLLIAALHQAGLATLTHTPSPMDFLGRILNRPSNEKPFVLIVTGHPAEDAVVPDIRRKALHEICSFV